MTMGDSRLAACWKPALEESSFDSELMLPFLSLIHLLAIHNHEHMKSWNMIAGRHRNHELAQIAVNGTGRASVCIDGFHHLHWILCIW